MNRHDPRPVAPDIAEPDTRPLHRRIRAVLEERIMAGDYPVGSLMPPEVELAREFDTSRNTLREALRYLMEHGYVERRAGVGTRVVSAGPRTGYTLSVASLEELFQVAEGTFFAIADIEDLVLDADLAEIVGGAEGEGWFRLSGLRWTEPGGAPICYVQSYIPKRFAPLLPELQRLSGPLFALLERHAGSPIERTVQEISACPMPPRIARLICQRPEAWALRLLRRYVTREGVLIASVNWHPAEAMTYFMEIRRTGAALAG